MIESQFKTYFSKPTLGLRNLSCIITAFQQENELITEWFYVNSNKVSDWHARAFSISAPLDIELTTNAQRFWESETLPHLKNAIYHEEIYPLLEKEPRLYDLCPSVELYETDRATMFSVKKQFPGFLEKTRTRTNCESLKKFIDFILSIDVRIVPIEF